MNEEKRLREIFQSLKKEDESRAPSFDRLASGSRSSLRKRFRPAFKAAAALLLFIAAGWFILKNPGTDSQNVLQTAEMISRWQSPTEFLLRIPQNSALSGVPEIGDSISKTKALLRVTEEK